MKEAKTTSGKTYSVHTANGCTVSDDSGWSKTIAAPDGYFTAHGSTVYLSDDEATMREVFKLAPMAISGGGGGLGSADVRPAVMYLLIKELSELLNEDDFDVDTDGQAIIVHTDRLDENMLEKVQDVIQRFVPANIEVQQYNHDISYNWREYPLPLGYDVLDRIELTGTQYIITGLYGADENSYADFKGYRSNNNSAQFNTFGLGSAYGKGNFHISAPAGNGNIYSGYIIGIGSNINNHDVFIKKDFVSMLQADGSYVEFKPSEFLNPQAPADERPLVLGAWRTFSDPMVGYIKRFRARMTNGEVDLIPALSPTGTPCMFDKVSKQPFFSDGADDFLYPGKELEASTFSLRRPITYAQLTEHGVCRLYHVPNGYNGTKEEYAAEHGFKPLVETSAPEEGYWAPHWVETDEEIILEWVETEPPAEESQPTE